MSELYNWIFEGELDENPLLTTQTGTYTLADLKKETIRYEKLLQKASGLKGKKVALIIPVVPSYLSLALAVNHLDGIIIPISSLLRQGDLTSILEFVDPHIVFTVEQHGGVSFNEIVRKWAGSTKKETMIFQSSDCFNWTEETIPGAERPIELQDGLCMIGCTSGSTGIPKGIMANFDFIKFANNALSQAVDLSVEDRTFLMVPTSGLYGLCWLFTSIYSRSHLIATESFNFPDLMELLKSNPANKLITSPSLYKALYTLNKTKKNSIINKVEWVALAGENISADFIETIAPIEKCAFTSIYGLSELGATMYTENDIRTGVQWTLSPGVEYKFKEQTKDGISELFFKTPYGFMGYYERPDLTEEVYKDSWFNSGDLARLTADNKVEIVGRKKDMIKKGGQQIIPSEIERVLSEHPAIEKAVVVGIPHKVYGEKVIAFVTEKEKVNVNEIYSFCQDKIARFKVPDQIYVIGELPLIQGKVDKVMLRQKAIESY